MSRKKAMESDKERYAAYLCSREWAEKKEAVRQRANGTCERCEVLPMDACHHLTYKRKYNELLEDLQAICNPCHEFTHAKSDFDPAAHRELLQWLMDVKAQGVRPMPLDFIYDLAAPNASIRTALLIRMAITHAILQARYMSDFNDICVGTVVDFDSHIDRACGFACPWEKLEKTISSQSPQIYETACNLIGLEAWATEKDLAKRDD